jgi:hypothetical protein
VVKLVNKHSRLGNYAIMSNSKILAKRIQCEGIPMAVPHTVPSDLLSRKERQVPAGIKQTISFRELAERRIITKGLNGAAAWLRAKVGLFPIEIEMQQQGDVYEMLVRVTYRPLPPVPEVVYERPEP